MRTTQYIKTEDAVWTSNLTHLLNKSCLRYLLSVRSYQMERVFGQGVRDVYEPDRGYTEDEWYFESSDGCIWGIGWRWDRTRLRGKGTVSAESAAEFVRFIASELSNGVVNV